MINKKIAVLVSGGGTNLGALIDSQKRGELVNGEITCVISLNFHVISSDISNSAAWILCKVTCNIVGTCS